jgi:Flp pilus assembly protein TadG
MRNENTRSITLCKVINHRGRRRASTLVELALVMPMLLLLALLIVQYSIFMNTAASIINLSREGARLAVSSQASDDVIKARIQDLKGQYGVNLADNDITITPVDDANRKLAGTLVTVSITYDMGKKLFLPPKLFGMTLFSQDYVGQTTMMMQPK